MIVVSDAPPLHYLILIDQDPLLFRIYGQVIVPEAVLLELKHVRAPKKVHNWMARPPEWLTVEKGIEPDPTIRLGLEEREAITLAGRHEGALLLTDDRQAVKVAEKRGIRVTGTLGVLEAAADLDFVTIPDVLERLRTETNFRATPEIFEDVLERDRARERAKGKI